MGELQPLPIRIVLEMAIDILVSHFTAHHQPALIPFRTGQDKGGLIGSNREDGRVIDNAGQTGG
jgi:hypothetical protein